MTGKDFNTFKVFGLCVIATICFTFIVFTNISEKNPYSPHEITKTCGKYKTETIIGQYEKDCSFGYNSCKKGKLIVKEIKRACI